MDHIKSCYAGTYHSDNSAEAYQLQPWEEARTLDLISGRIVNYVPQAQK